MFRIIFEKITDVTKYYFLIYKKMHCVIVVKSALNKNQKLIKTK